jgi:hypothetical protein
VNGDGRVSGRDVAFVARHLGRRSYDAKADLNHDGEVDLRDLRLVIVALIRRSCQ